ncbi:MAG: serine acetyltransferase [Gemmatimonas sp.]|nr:serine acetyltransferase [Gemmatimonas sp.]
MDTLRAQRRAEDRSYPLRSQAEAVVTRLLGLLFPPFAKQPCGGPAAVDAEAADLVALLRAALEPLVPNADDVVATLTSRLPAVQTALKLDAETIASGDPAAGSVEEVIAAYPGFLAMAVHRVAHELYLLGVPMFPRVLSEWAHRETGIDIHPGAQIGAAFAIDHGTGVVIGETSVIGDRVRIYQGVTLGALAVSKKLANRKRHPTIGNDVVIYANATILGGNTVVGDGSIIGGNVWLTSSVPPRSVVQFASRVEQRGDDGIEFHI